MIHRGIGLTLQKILPKFLPRSDDDVDALLDCKLRVYVHRACIFYIFYKYCIFYIFYIFAYFNFAMYLRFKRNGKDTKEIPLIGQGFQAYIDHLFWFLPFSNPKQAHEVLAKLELSDELWTSKREEVMAEHSLEQAPTDLRVGWKAWLADNGPGKEGPAAAMVPAAGTTSVVRK